jgi:molybdenum cofactor cytidylyltransferase
VEDAGHAGMGDSIAAAVGATRDAPGWLVLPGDLPLVAPESLRRVARELAAHAVVLPTHDGVRGHPVGFAAECRAALLALRGSEGAAAIVRAWAARGQAKTLALDDIGIVTDIDTLDDLARAERILGERSSAA